VLDRHQQAIGFHKFVEDLLHDVLGIGGIGHTPANEIAQPGSFFRDDLGDLTVLLSHHPRDPRRLIHSCRRTAASNIVSICRAKRGWSAKASAGSLVYRSKTSCDRPTGTAKD
jgi:hypothetical protein